MLGEREGETPVSVVAVRTLANEFLRVASSVKLRGVLELGGEGGFGKEAGTVG